MSVQFSMTYRSEPASVQRWEHIQERVEPSELDATLLKRSQEGWELVSSIGLQNDKSWDAKYRLFWKRLV